MLLVVLSIVASSTAQKLPKDEPDCTASGVARTEISDTDATILGFRIGHASLKNVQAKLGVAKVFRASKEEESDIFVCYVSSTDGTILAFYSGAMGGWVDITEFALWATGAGFQQRSQCTPSDVVSRAISTQSGLKLGLSRERLQRIAGKPSNNNLRSTKYEYVCRRKMTENEIKNFKTNNNWDVRDDPYFDRTSWIEVRYSNSTASHIAVGEIESY